MAGSLWRQRSMGARPRNSPTGGDMITNLTGRPMAGGLFTRYTGQAMELQLLDVSNGHCPSRPGRCKPGYGFPRWCPTCLCVPKNAGHFRIWTGLFKRASWKTGLSPNAKQNPRYYYGQWAHQPAPFLVTGWNTIVFVANPDIVYGMGRYTAPVAHPISLPSYKRRNFLAQQAGLNTDGGGSFTPLTWGSNGTNFG